MNLKPELFSDLFSGIKNSTGLTRMMINIVGIIEPKKFSKDHNIAQFTVASVFSSILYCLIC